MSHFSQSTTHMVGLCSQLFSGFYLCDGCIKVHVASLPIRARPLLINIFVSCHKVMTVFTVTLEHIVVTP